LKKYLYSFIALSFLFLFSSGEAHAMKYKVKKGDSLYKIATQHQTTVSKIKSLNGLRSNVIYVGQSLEISQSHSNVTSSPSIYTVQKGDSLWKISKKFNVSVSKLKNWNHVKNDFLAIGQKLIVSYSANQAKTTPVGNDLYTYTVLKGDNLWIISKKFNTTISAIKRDNALKSNFLYVGQKLYVKNSLRNFMMPSEGRFTSGFGNRFDGHHNGVDIANSGKVKIVSTADGVVSKSYLSKTYGEVVFVLHSINGKEYESVYAHMKENSRAVAVGDKVYQGQLIGYMGATGDARGQHLHFELHEGRWNYEKTNAVDPMKFLK